MTFKRLLRTAGPLLGLAATWTLFAVLVGANFVRWPNQELMLLQTAVVGAAAVGAVWIIVSGGIDLSVGANVALAAMVGAAVLRDGHALWLAVLAIVATSTLVGWLIGAVVTGALARAVIALASGAAVVWFAAGLGTPWSQLLALAVGVAAWTATRRVAWSLPLSPFIVTLGLWGALRGLAKGLGHNQPIYFAADDRLAAWMLPGGVLPEGVWLVLAVAALAALMLRRTVFGRHVLALGQNRQAARFAGIAMARTELLVYVLGGACAGVAAVLQLSFLSMGDPTTAQGLELKAIAAAVIGGASLTGGEGSVVGALVGALIMTVVDNGCTKLGLDNWVQDIVTGAIIVAAVALDRWRQARAA